MGEKNRKEKNHQNGAKVTLCFVLILFFSVIVFAVVGDGIWLKSNTVAGGVTMFGKNIGGFSFNEAEACIKRKMAAKRDQPFIVICGQERITLTCSELGFPDDEKALCDKVQRLGREGNIFKRCLFRLSALRGRKTELADYITIDSAKMSDVLARLKNHFNTRPKNARFIFDNEGKVEIVPSENGIFLHVAATRRHFSAVLKSPRSPEVTPVVAEVVLPEITTAALAGMRIDTKLASFTTYYSEAAVNRAHNIALAAEALDMKVIKEKESFSFNATVGQRSIERGFLSAAIIENGEYTDGLGGGVCQVSTTVYGAVLRTELKVTARRPHSLVSAYVEPGQDAMVAWETSDLCFENTYDTPVLLHTITDNGALTVMVYGNAACKREVEVKTEILSRLPFTTETVIDASLAPGTNYTRTQGKRGLECRVIRTVLKNGTVLRQETVSHDIYMAQKKIIVSAP